MPEQKLREIFDIFDRDRDDYINSTDFASCWTHWIKVLVGPAAALLVVDVQNDFIAGALGFSNYPPNQDPYEIIEPINRMLNTVDFRAVFYSLDWHPNDHISFIDNLHLREIDPSSPVSADDARVNDTVIFAGSPPITQKLWPRHCVQNTWGSELHAELRMVDNAIKIYKATDPLRDSYSAFERLPEKRSESVLLNHLRQKNITDLYICGLAYDFCVRETAIDSLAYGFRTIVIEDCSRGINLIDIDNTRKYILENNGAIVDSSKVKPMVEGRERLPELAYKLAIELRKNRFTGPTGRPAK